MAISTALRHHAWLRSAVVSDDTKTHIEDLPFDGAGLFNDKTTEDMDSLHKIRKTANSYSTQQTFRYQRPQWRKQPAFPATIQTLQITIL